MSQPFNANPCCSTDVTTQIPGPAGATGAAGTNGQNAFTLTTSTTTLPAANANVTVAVASSIWMAIGQIVIVSDGTNLGNFQVISFPSVSGVVLKWLNYPGDSVTTTVIASGASVSPAGHIFAVGSLPTAFTDNTTGAASNTLAVGVGVSTLAFWVNLSGLTNADILTAYTLGYKFKILSVAFGVQKAVTTAAKLATINAAISGVATTGGVLSLTSANCTPKGAVIPASAVTGTNTGSASATLSLTASAVTAFVEGDGWIFVEVQNMDVADAFASVSAHINSLITAL